MPFDEDLATRVREALGDRDDVQEKKMFGGLTFMVAGHMCCGIVGEELMVRVGPAQYGSALKQPGARPMDFTGRPMKGFLFVGSEGHASDEALLDWVRRASEFVAQLPATR